MQLLPDKVLWKKGLQPVPAALALQGDARLCGGAVDVEVDAVGEASALGAPADGEHTALVHSVLQSLGRRQAPKGKLQARIVYLIIQIILNVLIILKILKILIIQIILKIPMVDFQEGIPLGNLPVGGHLPQPHAQHRRGRRGELDHRLEPRPLLQLRR